jgi:hypothetical protein
MDSDFRIDVGEIKANIDVAEVLAVYFPLLRKTLLLDSRSNDIDKPMIKVVPMAASPEERFQSLKQLRPRFPRPESITIIPWPKYAASLSRLGIWDHIVRRFADMGDPDLVRECEACLQELLTLEQDEVRHAVSGENYEVLWSRKGSGEGGEGSGGRA